MKTTALRRRLWAEISGAIQSGGELPPMFEDAGGHLCLSAMEPGSSGFNGPKQIPESVLALLAEHRPEIIAFAYWARIAREAQTRLDQRPPRA